MLECEKATINSFQLECNGTHVIDIFFLILFLIQETYTVESILKERKTAGGKLEFLVKWAGYTHEHNTWEPKRNLIDPIILQNY